MHARTIAAAAGVVALLTGCVPQSGEVPREYRAQVKKAGKECPQVSAKLISAQLEQESGWDPKAVSSQGAQGIAQFMPDTWRTWGVDANDDGSSDPFDPDDAIKSQGLLMCHLVGLAKASDLSERPIVLALAAYNAGWGHVTKYRGVPPFPETEGYIEIITDRAKVIRLHD